MRDYLFFFIGTVASHGHLYVGKCALDRPTLLFLVFPLRELRWHFRCHVLLAFPMVRLYVTLPYGQLFIIIPYGYLDVR